MDAVCQACSVDIGSLDFIVSDAGAMIWHVIANDDAGEEGGTATMECDEDYEKHIDFRWDAHVAKQVRLCSYNGIRSHNFCNFINTGNHKFIYY